MTTIPKPVLGEPDVDTEHKRSVRIPLADAEPIQLSYARKGVPVRIQPRALTLTWKGAPARLTGVVLSGYELTKSGAVNARGLSHSHPFMTTEYVEDGRTETGAIKTRRERRLNPDVPDWIRELIEQYRPDWPELT